MAWETGATTVQEVDQDWRNDWGMCVPEWKEHKRKVREPLSLDKFTFSVFMCVYDEPSCAFENIA